jgi:hypothetical protein
MIIVQWTEDLETVAVRCTDYNKGILFLNQNLYFVVQLCPKFMLTLSSNEYQHDYK